MLDFFSYISNLSYAKKGQKITSKGLATNLTEAMPILLHNMSKGGTGDQDKAWLFNFEIPQKTLSIPDIARKFTSQPNVQLGPSMTTAVIEKTKTVYPVHTPDQVIFHQRCLQASAKAPSVTSIGKEFYWNNHHEFFNETNDLSVPSLAIGMIFADHITPPHQRGICNSPPCTRRSR